MAVGDRRTTKALLATILALSPAWGCADKVVYRGSLIGHQHSASAPELTRDPKTLDSVKAELKATRDPFLKCHLWDGSVIVLQDYRLEGEAVVGDGIRYDSTRAPVERRHFTVPLTEVALFETNRPETVSSARVPIMATVTVASAALTALCITAPKACFGSCPTIYAPGSKGYTLQAEGFSSSIAKILEATDVDALSDVPEGEIVSRLEVTNEAPETHAIESMTLLAAERPKDGFVFRSGSRYFTANHPQAPTKCVSASGDCLAAVSQADELEYKSDTDGEDLTHKEIVELEFPNRKEARLGLVLTARNTLLNSYLFYQALAYLGEEAGNYLALLERGRLPALSGSRRIGDLLGGVDVSVSDGKGGFLPAGQYFEVGPLAKETEVFEIPKGAATPLVVRLTMSRGNMRLDRIAQIALGAEVIPERLEPMRVVKGGTEEAAALAQLREPNRYLVTYPGDAYDLFFPKPKCERCAWFVESRGYYYEWMRDVWFVEQDRAKLVKLLFAPEAALKELAPAYRRIEPEIDRLFWESHIEPHRATEENRP
jgi:hypothetical protein